MSYFALVTEDGTACSETALCGLHYESGEARQQAESQAASDAMPESWTDVSGNRYIEQLTGCVVCGFDNQD